MVVLGSVPQRLARDRYLVDEESSHIEVDQAALKASDSGDLLIRICPARVFSRAGDGSLAVEEAACLECGTCLAVAPPGALTWRYPRGGFGVVYREG